MSAPASSALFAGRYTREELERVRDYLKDQLVRETYTYRQTERNRALQFELDILETALACLPLPQMLRLSNDNLFDDHGHGHVFPRRDGMKARCGGPGLCQQCSRDQARKNFFGEGPDGAGR